MTDEELLKAVFNVLLAWLKPMPGIPADEALLQIIELYEKAGRDFIKADWPAND